MNYWWTLCKVVFIYSLLIILLRILGKREVGQLSIFDLVVILIIADIASLGIDNDDFFVSSILCLILISAMQKLLSLLLMKFSKLRNLFEGSPTIIILDGQINIKNMQKELYTIDDLLNQIRSQGIMNINEIKLAILETNGQLSVFKKSDNDLIEIPIILSGKYIYDNFNLINITAKEIDLVLKENQINMKGIIYASFSDGQLTYYNNGKEEIIKSNILTI